MFSHHCHNWFLPFQIAHVFKIEYLPSISYLFLGILKPFIVSHSSCRSSDESNSGLIDFIIEIPNLFHKILEVSNIVFLLLYFHINDILTTTHGCKIDLLEQDLISACCFNNDLCNCSCHSDTISDKTLPPKHVIQLLFFYTSSEELHDLLSYCLSWILALLHQSCQCYKIPPTVDDCVDWNHC